MNEELKDTINDISEYCTHSCLEGCCGLGYTVCDKTACPDYELTDEEID